MALSFGLHFVILHVDFLAVVFQITPLSFAQWMVVINSHCPSFYWTSCSNGLPEITLTLLEKDLIKRKSSVSKPKDVKKKSSYHQFCIIHKPWKTAKEKKKEKSEIGNLKKKKCPQ